MFIHQSSFISLKKIPFQQLTTHEKRQMRSPNPSRLTFFKRKERETKRTPSKSRSVSFLFVENCHGRSLINYPRAYQLHFIMPFPFTFLLSTVFWDIENCSVPHGKSAARVVEKIRRMPFMTGRREMEVRRIHDFDLINK